MRHTFILKAGRRLTVARHPAARGCALVQVLGADHAPIVSLSLDADMLRAMSHAFGLAAIEAAAAQATDADVAGV